MFNLGILSQSKTTFQNVASGITPVLELGSVISGAMVNITKGYRQLSIYDPTLPDKTVYLSPNVNDLIMYITFPVEKKISRINLIGGEKTAGSVYGSNTPNSDLPDSDFSFDSIVFDAFNSAFATVGGGFLLNKTYMFNQNDFTEVANVKTIYISMKTSVSALFTGIEIWGNN